VALRHPSLPAEVIEKRFHLAAALRSEHALQDWALTETAWAHPGRLRSGPFEFDYDYQRADLEVRGPSFYDFDGSEGRGTIYTASGMAAISALLLATGSLLPEADILTLPGTYGETIELIESHARHLRLVALKKSPAEVEPASRRPRIFLFDSCTSAAAFEASLHCGKATA
jgi:hypothetical protein